MQHQARRQRQPGARAAGRYNAVTARTRASGPLSTLGQLASWDGQRRSSSIIPHDGAHDPQTGGAARSCRRECR